MAEQDESGINNQMSTVVALSFKHLTKSAWDSRVHTFPPIEKYSVFFPVDKNDNFLLLFVLLPFASRPSLLLVFCSKT